MSTRRPVPPAGELPEPYPGDTEMLKRARKENIARKVHDEELENLERIAYEKEQEARAAKRKAEKVAGIAKWAEAEHARLRKIAADKREQELSAMPEILKDARYRAINCDALHIARTLARNLFAHARLLIDIFSDTVDAYSLEDNKDIRESRASIHDNINALDDLISMTGRIKTAIERGQA